MELAEDTSRMLIENNASVHFHRSSFALFQDL